MDVIAQAQSGTGKTATFSIAILEKIDTSLRECQALILAPTRELAQQIQKVIDWMKSDTWILLHNYDIIILSACWICNSAPPFSIISFHCTSTTIHASLTSPLYKINLLSFCNYGIIIKNNKIWILRRVNIKSHLRMFYSTF